MKAEEVMKNYVHKVKPEDKVEQSSLSYLSSQHRRPTGSRRPE